MSTQGLSAVAQCDPATCLADIVFVHGLAGDAIGTWTFDAPYFFWPAELAKDLPQCSVWTLGYPAGISNFGEPGMIIEKRAGNFAHKLVNAKLGERPIVFITHSMGGLIVKALVVNHADADRRKIAAAVAGIVFCATPHRGSTLANAASVLGTFLGGAQPHVEQMQRDNDHLDFLHDSFVEWQREREVPIDSYAENRELLKQRPLFRPLPMPLVVPRASANPNIAGHTVTDVDHDHFSICKPPNRQDDVYAGVLRFLHEIFAVPAAATPKARAPEPSPPTPADEQAYASVASPISAPIRSADVQSLLQRLNGFDPVAGEAALHELLACADEEVDHAVFEQACSFPSQVLRRQLSYIAARLETMAPLLLTGITSEQAGANRYAPLFAVFTRKSTVTDALFGKINQHFHQVGDRHCMKEFQHEPLPPLLAAYGYAGGSRNWLWSWASGNHYAWDKLRVIGFRASCASLARCGGDASALHDFLTQRYSGLPDAHGNWFADVEEERLGSRDDAIDQYEMSKQASFGPFSLWKRGDVADDIVRSWSKHEHARVRRFGAEVVAQFRFQRLAPAMRAWLDGETDTTARQSLERGLLDLALDGDHDETAPVAAAADQLGLPIGESIVTMARSGQRFPGFEQLRDETDWYLRACVALAGAYLKDGTSASVYERALTEAAVPLERLLLMVAYVLSGQLHDSHRLHQQLVVYTEGDGPFVQDLRYLCRPIQLAILDALAACGDATVAAAWAKEFEGFAIVR